MTALDAPVPDAPAPVRSRRTLLQLVVFAAVGAAFNVLYALLYLLFREGLEAQPANALALVLSTIAGTWGHRRVTFRVRGRRRTVRHQVLGLALLAFSLAVTAGSLALLQVSDPDPSRTAEILVLAAANLGVGLIRFGLFRAVMVPTTPRPDAL
ncbi:GtrA family protein [Nocardioides sp. AX2bis]|uniref:GtrA family protein n=1 Tax=Nocardioides sp. AX2bis TaxID=2653157 RepID=UPI0012F46BCC|nr:GtrA family protein [Nocardioides sp. AX2bis]VXC47006.1 Putative flippase GtrA [Nocardioides sp. AX2bis]